jgi:probable rRNA maturation factor
MSEFQLSLQYNSNAWAPFKNQLKPRFMKVCKLASSCFEHDFFEHDVLKVNVNLSDNPQIHQLNLLYRQQDKPTNVLSFPFCEKRRNAFYLGEIVISFEKMQNEANEQSKSFYDHLTHLFTHSLLHLFGFDHENEADANQMEALEIQILQHFNIKNPY